jgi:hypothetical protein
MLFYKRLSAVNYNFYKNVYKVLIKHASQQSIFERVLINVMLQPVNYKFYKNEFITAIKHASQRLVFIIFNKTQC